MVVENNSFAPSWITEHTKLNHFKVIEGFDNSNSHITEIMLTDERGVFNCCESNLTSDYWQGDEEKIIETLKMANEYRHINSLGRFDQSNNRFKMPSIEFDASSKLFYVD